ncbi:MAG TPA: Xaa-Pro peptidase family protein [Spirochaetia bacterium]|nr:Xaa-Pro peptidase family protein [Spirochaetia bacterium]
MKVPFDAAKLDRLMDEAGLSLVIANTRHNVRYLCGGYYYHFHANSSRMGRSQYLSFVGVPRGRLHDSFYVARAEERDQMESEGLWIPVVQETIRGTVTAAASATEMIRRLGLSKARIGIEIPFIPADAFLTMQRELPEADLVDATAVFDELRAIKNERELAILRSVYTGVAESIQAAFQESRCGETTLSIAQRVELEMARRSISFLFSFVCAGPGFLRAPSSETWERGQVLHIDAGGNRQDYIADICRMGCLGEPSPLARELHQACIEVQDQVRSLVRPGAACRDVLAAGQAASRRYPFSSCARFVVHSIGMVPYEQPAFLPESARLLEKGMVISIETDFLHPQVGHVKIEDAVAVTETGCEGLGDLGRDWHVIPM